MKGGTLNKRKLNYRNAEPRSPRRCVNCREFQRVGLTGIGGVYLGPGLRCAPIGTGASRKYAIHEIGVCDCFEERN